MAKAVFVLFEVKFESISVHFISIHFCLSEFICVSILRLRKILKLLFPSVRVLCHSSES